jgi:1-phosphofructokinase
VTGGAAGIAVFSPAPRLTITIEAGPHAVDEPHLHVGGQGPWAARMAALLGADVQLCVPLGGETGSVVAHLLERSPLRLRVVDVRGDTAMYLHDRRSGSRRQLAATREPPLDRHELDDLYNVTVGAALECGTALLTGTVDPGVVDAHHYGRLVGDLRANGVLVVVDLSGAQLLAAADAGADVVKVSHEELLGSGCATSADPAGIDRGIDCLQARGAGDVIVTRAGEPARAALAGVRYDIVPPPLATVEHRGAGDSLTGAFTAALAQGRDRVEAVRVGTAAGALNVTRHGLATGIREAIVAASARVGVRCRA